ncbi:MAG: HEPN domain-containing protein [Clostridia bacterium]|nr:HEPN domain-containing protein [Bacteroidales bacterium]MBR3917260.1 HEPN domain-containing protein [Clostridia bacterium]
MVTEEERKALVLNKVHRSRETWAEAKGIIENKYWYAAANRMYYACYYMVSALLLNNGQSAHTHGGIIGLFGLHFVKTGIVSSEMGKFYSEMYELRQTGDYDDWKTLAESDIMPLIPKVEQFLDVVEKLIIADGDMD